MNEVGKEVATIPLQTDTVLMYPVTDQEIERLAAEYKEVPTDLTIKANYELCRKAASEIRSLRGETEKWRKDKKADALAWGKKVDGAAKTITERLLAIEEPFANAKKDFDTAVEIAKREAVLAEERRVDGIADRIAGIKALAEANISSSSAVIKEVMAKITSEEVPIGDWACEFAGKALSVITETLGRLDELLAMKLTQEQAAIQQAQDEARRKDEEELARQQREAEIEAERKKIAAERAEMDAKQAVIDAERQKEQEQLAADRAELAAEREKIAAAEQERARLADEEADKKKAEEAEAARQKAKEEELATQQAETAEVAKIREETIQEPQPAGTIGTTLDQQRNAAGQAMMKFVGNKQITKNLIDAILNYEIPNIQFITGA